VRKRIRVVLAAVAGLFVVALLASLSWIYSGGFDRWLVGQVKRTLAEMHVRAEVGDAQLGFRAGTFAARDVALFVEGDTEPFFAAAALSARFDYTVLWQRHAELRELTLSRPHVVVRFDAGGNTSLGRIELPASPEGEGGRVSYGAAKVRIEDGEIVYGDENRRMAGAIDNLAVEIYPTSGFGEDLVRRLEVAFGESRLIFDGREMDGIAMRLGADLRRDGATIDTFSLETPAGTANLSGKVTDWTTLRYELEAGARLDVDRVAMLVDPASGYAGSARLDGTVAGDSEGYSFVGNLVADDLYVTGLRANAVRLGGDFSGHGSEFAFEGTLGAGNLSAAGVAVSGFDFDGRVTGDAERGAATLDGSATVARASAEGFDASGVRFRGTVDAKGDGVSGDGAATIGRVTGNGIDASDVRYEGSFGASSAGDVRIGGMSVRAVRVGDVRARVVAERGEVRVDGLVARMYEGTVTGSARMRLSGGGASSFSADFENIDIDKAAGVATPDAPRVNGLASGRIALTWPGSNVQAATGKITATVDGTLPAEQGAPLPLDGRVELTALPGRFRIDKADLRSGSSRMEVTGTVGWNRTADLRVVADAADASNLEALVAAANPLVARQIASNGVALGGAFRFEGTVTGPIVSPVVDGSIRIGDVAYQGMSLGAFSASVARTGGAFRLHDAHLAQPGGGDVAFAVDLPATASGALRVTARLDNVDLAPFVGADARLKGGRAYGEVDLRLLPAGPDVPPREGLAARIAVMGRLRGPIDLTIRHATLDGEPLDDVVVKAALGENAIELANLRLASARGTVDASGVFKDIADPGAFSYELAATMKDVDLALLRPSGRAGPAVSGRASGTISLAGRGDRPFTSLTADVTGRDVVVNGKAVTDPRLAIVTDKSVATASLAATVLGAPREISGRIDISNNLLPFEAEFELDDTEVMQYARLVSDVPDGVTARATGLVALKGNLAELVAGGTLMENASVDANLGKLSLSVAVEETGRVYEISNAGSVVVSSADGAIQIQQTKFAGEGTSLDIAGSLAFAEGGMSNLRLSGDVNLALLTSFTTEAFATGTATLQATVAGTAAAPRFTGFADVRDASLRVVDAPLTIYNGTGRILFTANQALIESFTAQSGGGSLAVGGGVLFAGLGPDRWRFEMEADQVNLSYPAGTRSVVDGDLVLFGDAQGQVLSGEVNLRRAEYTDDVDLNDLITIGRSGSITGGEALGAGPPSPIRLDLRVEARDSLVVRNNLADAVGSASLTLSGPLNNPIVDGRATVTRGTLQFRQGEYQVRRGVVRFPGRQGGDISFDMQAEADIKGYRVTVGFAGTLEKFYPTFSSDPALPQTQIVSLVLTGDLGDPNEAITSKSITQTGVSVAGSLIGEAVSRSVEKRTERLFGINRFQIDPVLAGGTDPSARLTVGRRINKNLSITYSTNINSTDEQVIQLEYRISDRFAFVAAREDDGSYGVDFRVRKRF
jgi:translocation and assembly module TamB